MQYEFEAKFLNIDAENMRDKLKVLGYTCTHPERLMRRVTIDFDPDHAKSFCRIRDEGHKITMTYKNISDPTRIEGVQEVELIVNDFDTAISFARQFGGYGECYQETRREEWGKGDVEVMIDTWPGIPTFIEIEAPTIGQVKQSSIELDFDYSKAVFGTVVEVYKEHQVLTLDQLQSRDRLTFDQF